MKTACTVWVAAVLLAAVRACVAGESADAAALHARYEELRAELADNAFHQPLTLSSSEAADRVEGEAYAEVPHPFAAIAPAFKSGVEVCSVLLLHLNVHGCRAMPAGDDETIELWVGPKRQFFGAGYGMSYRLHIEADRNDYLRATLTAVAGPLSTSDYRVLIKAVPLDPGRSFVHCRYAYATGGLAKLAMRIYLATAGRSKIGFTVVDKGADGRPVYVGGERGSLERNAMRYYLAVVAFATASPEPLETRSRAWFALTERYRAQLHELELDEYLDEKRRDVQRRRGD